MEADIRDIDALGIMATSLARFAHGAQETCTAAQVGAQRVLEWLESRLLHWRREVETWQLEVERLGEELADCESSGEEDCTPYENALAAAETRLEEADRELASASLWLARVEQALGDYRAQALRLRDLVSDRGGNARIFLELKQAEAERIRAVTTPAVSVAEGSSASTGPRTSSRSSVGTDAHFEEAAQALRSVRGLGPDEWQRTRDRRDRTEILQRAENKLASLQGRDPVPVVTRPLGRATYGGYNGREIEVSEAQLDDIRETLDTLLHESFHAYQHYAIRHPEVDHRSRVWEDNFRSTYRDPSEYGYERYAAQPVEASATSYASEILRRYDKLARGDGPVND